MCKIKTCSVFWEEVPPKASVVELGRITTIKTSMEAVREKLPRNLLQKFYFRSHYGGIYEIRADVNKAKYRKRFWIDWEHMPQELKEASRIPHPKPQFFPTRKK